MAVSEERLQLLLPRRLKRSVQREARRLGLSVGEYVRQLIEADLRRGEERGPAIDFPFGRAPVRSGRRRGSIDHDRPE